MISALFISLLVFTPHIAWQQEAEKLAEQKKAEQEVAVESHKPEVVYAPPQYTANSPFVNRLNEIRTKNGLKPLIENDSLNQSAQGWSAEMARSGYRHSDFGWEAIAYSCGLFTDPLTAWMNSSGHRRILMGDFTYIGYGMVDTGGCQYYTGHVK